MLPSGVRLRAGTGVVWSAFLLGRDPQLFSQPLRFDPDRFLEASADAVSSCLLLLLVLLTQRALQPSNLPFQHGPRRCLGVNSKCCCLFVCLFNKEEQERMAYLEVSSSAWLVLLSSQQFSGGVGAGDAGGQI